MKIQDIKNAQSFGMGWTKDSQRVLKQVVAKLDKKEAQNVLAIAERLQTKSSNYNLIARDYSVSAVANPEYAYPGSAETFDFIKKGMFRRFKTSVIGAFKSLEKHVSKTNNLVPVNKQKYDTISSRIEPLFDKNSEFGFCHNGKEDMAYSLVLLSSKKNGTKRVDTAIKRLFAINERAKKKGFSIDFDNFDFNIPTVRISLKQKDNQRYGLAPFKLDCDIDKGTKRINAEMTHLSLMCTVICPMMKVAESFVGGIVKISNAIEKLGKKIKPSKMDNEEISSKIDKIFKQ